MTSTRPFFLQPRGKLVLRLVAQPVGDDGADDRDVAGRRDGLPEAERPVHGRGRARPALDLDDPAALASQELRDVLARLLADEPVVGADEQRVVDSRSPSGPGG